MKYIKLFESTKEVINIDNGEVLSMDANIFNKLSDNHIIVWNKDIEQHVYSDEFSSLIKDYILKYKPIKNSEKKIIKKRLGGQVIFVGGYYYCKKTYPIHNIVKKFIKGYKYQVVDIKWDPPDDWVYIRYYKEENNKPIRSKMLLDVFNRYFRKI